MNNLPLIQKKIIFLIIGFFFFACFNPALFASNEPNKEDIDLTGPENALSEAMDKLFSLIDTIEKEKELSDKEKTQKIFDQIKKARWGPEQDNYFWIFDVNGNTVGEPVCIDLEGQSINNYTITDYKDNPEGKKLFTHVINRCNEKGEAYFQYLMPDCRRDPAYLKIALARLLADKKWIIVTGIYHDTIEAYQEPVNTDVFVPADDGPGPIEDNQPASGT
jgi:signal transduction histidine kinase